jgi:hypothetical protein
VFETITITIDTNNKSQITEKSSFILLLLFLNDVKISNEAKVRVVSKHITTKI